MLGVCAKPRLHTQRCETERGPERSCRINTQGFSILKMYLWWSLCTRMPGESYRRRLGSLLLYLCYVLRALINSLVCWLFTHTFIQYTHCRVFMTDYLRQTERCFSHKKGKKRKEKKTFYTHVRSVNTLLGVHDWLLKAKRLVLQSCKKEGETRSGMDVPGPLAPPDNRRPSRNMTALSYSWTTCNHRQRIRYRGTEVKTQNHL